MLEAACALFYRDGIHAVGVDTIAAAAGVTKAALYGNFGSKQQLVVAYLRERERLWQQRMDRITAEHSTPRERISAVFDAYVDWLSGDRFRGCAFLNAAAEFPDPDHPARQVVRHHKDGVRGYLRAQFQRIDPGRREALAEQVLLLLEGGAAMSVVEQDDQPIRAAQRLAEDLLAAV